MCRQLSKYCTTGQKYTMSAGLVPVEQGRKENLGWVAAVVGGGVGGEGEGGRNILAPEMPQTGLGNLHRQDWENTRLP